MKVLPTLFDWDFCLIFYTICCPSLSFVPLFATLWIQQPGIPVHHQLPELAQTHVHWVGDAIQLSHPLSSPSLPAFSLSQHQGLFQWVSSSHQVAKTGVSASASVLPMNIQDWFPLALTGFISLQSKGLSRIFSNNSKASILQCLAIFIVQLSLPCMTTGKTIALTRRTFNASVSWIMTCLTHSLMPLPS